MRRLLLIPLLLHTLLIHGQFLVSVSQDRINGVSAYSEVEPGDTIYLEAGIRDQLIIQELHGEEGAPVVIVPEASELPVIIHSEGNYGISVRSCSFIRISGLYEYGIRIMELAENEQSVGISIGDKSTNVEIDHVEIANTGFAGILAKTDPIPEDPSTQRGQFVQKDTWVHHCYIHDTGGEGVYIGHTSFDGFQTEDGVIYPHILEGVRVYRNIIEKTGWDGIQISSTTSGCVINDNVLRDNSLRQTNLQKSGIIIGGGTRAECYNNQIIDCHATGILVFGMGGTRVFNNLIVRPGKQFFPDDPEKREHGIFIEDKTNTDESFYGVFSNTIIQPKSDAIRIGNQQDFEVIMYNNILVDPGARTVYENDNTDRTEDDAFIFLVNDQTPVTIGYNAYLIALYMAGFMNPDDDKYQLLPDSRMIDSGRDLSDYPGVNFDLQGNSRPLNEGWDLGAYEYNSSGVAYQREEANTPIQAVWGIPFYGQHEIRVSVQANCRFSWRITTLSGQVIAYQTLQNYHAGVHNLKRIPARSGGMVIQLIGENWQYSKKLLVN